MLINIKPKLNRSLKIMVPPLLALLICCGLAGTALAQKFDKVTFYTVMASGNLDDINKELDVLSNAQVNEKTGYEGALLMRKAGLVTKAKDKLAFFKAGRIKFDTALQADMDNVEYRFLRLTIQEHAPKIVHYHSDIGKDKTYIQKNFKNLSPVVQHAVFEYSKTSKVLHPDDFNAPQQ